MARKMMFNPSYQRAFTEAIERENQVRPFSLNFHLVVS